MYVALPLEKRQWQENIPVLLLCSSVSSFPFTSSAGSVAGELERLQSMLTKGVTATSSLWADVQTGYHWVYRAAHILSNDEKLKGAQVRQRYERLLAEMADVSASSEALTTMLTTFRKVTASYWPGLFHCYDVPDLPRTNNGLEYYFGSARYSER